MIAVPSSLSNSSPLYSPFPRFLSYLSNLCLFIIWNLSGWVPLPVYLIYFFFLHWCPVIPCLILCFNWYIRFEHFSNTKFTCRLSFQSKPRGNYFFVILIFETTSLLMTLNNWAYWPKEIIWEDQLVVDIWFHERQNFFPMENTEFF